MKKISLIFFGNSKISEICLKSLIDSDIFDIKAVVTTKDRKIGRSHTELFPTPVALIAQKNNIDIIKTDNINKDVASLKEYSDVELYLTCSFAQYLSSEVLSLPKIEALNIHASLLPKGRGGAPIHWAIINGEKETGISIMRMVDEMDAGDYFVQSKINIDANETYHSLYKKLSDLIYEVVPNYLLKIYSKELKPIQQDESKVTKWLNIKKEDSKINFDQSNIDVDYQIRGLYDKPLGYASVNDLGIKIASAIIVKNSDSKAKVGEVVEVSKEGILIQCKKGQILIKEIILPSKKINNMKNLINGNLPFKVGDIFNG